jgi:hypothetical protein
MLTADTRMQELERDLSRVNTFPAKYPQDGVDSYQKQLVTAQQMIENLQAWEILLPGKPAFTVRNRIIFTTN